jgi:hypothetical protein
MCYDLTAGQMDETIVTDGHTAESTTVFTIEPGAIYMADAGFGTGKNLQHIVSCQANALFRATPNHLCLAGDEKGKDKIDMVTKLDTKADVLDFTCFLHTANGKYMPIRIIASRLPDDKALLAIKRKKRNAQRHQSKIREKTLIYAGWIILATTLGDEYKTEDLLKMYRARWQIELMFKRIKQFFNITKLRAATLEHSKAMILLWLIQWSMVERQTVYMERVLASKNMNLERYSPWTMQNFFFHIQKTFINCLWTLPFDFELHAININLRLQNHASSRDNHYAHWHFDCSGLSLCTP